MAITTAGFQGPVTESQEAGRFYRIAPPALTDDAASLRPSVGSGTRAVSVSAGAAQVCGVTVTSTPAVTVTFSSNTSSSARLDMVILRVTWAGSSSSAVITTKTGTTSAPPTPTRNPGSTYEFPLAVVRIRQNVTAVASSDIFDLRTYGGRGGRLRVPQETYIGFIDGHVGAEVIVDGSTRTYRKATDGAWVLVSDILTPWRFFDPVVRYQGAGNVQAGTANLGTGGVRRGRFKVFDQFLIGEVEIRTGSGGWYFGAGPLTVDLPPGFLPDTFFADRWIHGHMYTTNESLMDWTADALVKGGASVALLYSTVSAADARMRPAQVTDASLKVGTGVPLIGTANSDPAVICLNLCYSLGG